MEQHKAGLPNNEKPKVGLSAMEWVVKQDAGGAERNIGGGSDKNMEGNITYGDARRIP